MTDTALLAAAYLLVAGGIVGYALSLARRASATRRLERIVRRRDAGSDAAATSTDNL